MALKRLPRSRRLAVIALSAFVGLVAAVINSGMVSLSSPHLRLHNLRIAAAATFVDVDPPASVPSLAHGSGEYPYDIGTYIKRAELLGRIIVTQPVLDRIAPRCAVPPGQLSGLGRITADVPFTFSEPYSEQRGSDIEASRATYQLEVEARPTVPIIDVYAQAPSLATAQCLANTAPVALTAYLKDLARQEGSTDPLVQLRPLGPARGGIVNGGATPEVAFLTFLTFFGLTVAALKTLVLFRRRGREPRPDPPREPPTYHELEFTTSAHTPARDSWPHTTRLLPWTLAVLIAVVWLTPFNDISLNASLPIEIRLDRMVLPFVVIAWLLALSAGGRFKPRMKLSFIHVVIGLLLAAAFLSVVTDARYLNQTLAFSLSLKKLPLLVSYVAVFVIASSAVRRSEVRPFMTYTLGLAVIVAAGMVVEYRTTQNVFWMLSAKLLPGGFTLNASSGDSAIDYIGRRIVRGPAEVPLEAVAMLSMALPIAVVRIMESPHWRSRLKYGAMTGLIVAAIFSTYRKSGFIAPVAVLLTLAYFRRRELLRLAPLGLVLLAMVSALSPRALGSVLGQFTRSDAKNVPTVSSRTSAYDAIRPDVWSHLLLGRGWGSYDPNDNRILDSEILLRLIEGGVVGLAAFVLVPVGVIAASRRTIALREPESSPIALVGASAAVAFLVMAFLYDELSFPHPVYIFFYIVGMETVILRQPTRREERRPPPVFLRRFNFDRPEPGPRALAEASLVPER
jgi:hypothetical protein